MHRHPDIASTSPGFASRYGVGKRSCFVRTRTVPTRHAGCQRAAAVIDPSLEQPLFVPVRDQVLHEGEFFLENGPPEKKQEIGGSPAAGFPPTAAARQRFESQQAGTVQMPTPAAVATASRPSLGPSAVMFMLGAAVASTFQSLASNLTTAAWQDVQTEQSARAPDPFGPDAPPLPPRQEMRQKKKDIVPDSESVEWVNMCVRKIWRVYQRGLETWISGLLQPVFDSYINEDSNPAILQRIRIARFTLNHEPPVFERMQRRNSRKESDLNGVFSVRYSGGAKMLLVLELGGKLSGVEIPVMVEDFDLDARMWIKVRLAPMCPWIGVISVAFVEQPRIQVQLNTYGMLPLMRIPVLQNFLRKLLTVELPGVMVLPQRLEINLPPSVTVLAEAAVGRDTVMRAVASAVLQADAMEQALINALPMDAANVASAVSVPEAFVGEVAITVVEGRDLPVWGFPWQSNPYCRIVLGSQAVDSKRERETGSRGSFRCPNWNQEFQFLVEDSPNQCVNITIYDSPYTGRTEVGHTKLLLEDMPQDGTLQVWLPVTISPGGTEVQGELYVRASYRAFDNIGDDSGLRLVNDDGVEPTHDITDVQSAAEASARAAVEASKGIEALAVAKAAAARAAARLRGRSEQGSNTQNGAGRGRLEEDGSSSSDEAIGGDTETWPQAAPLGSLEGEHVYAQRLVTAVEDNSRNARAEALASELKQGAVARVTDNSTSPLRQPTLKKRIDELAAPIAAELATREEVASAMGQSTESRTPAAGGSNANGRASDVRSGEQSTRGHPYSDFDLVAEGDGSSASMEEVKSMHQMKEFEEREVSRSAASPLLPGGLPGPGGSLLDEFMVREATTRVSAVDTEDLAMLQRGRDVKAPAATGKGAKRRTGGESDTDTVDITSADASRTAVRAAASAAAAGVAAQAARIPRSDGSSATGTGASDSSTPAATHSYDGGDGSGYDGGGKKWGTGGGLDSDSEALSTIDLGDSVGQHSNGAARADSSEGAGSAREPAVGVEEAVNASQKAEEEPSHNRQPWWWPFGRTGSDTTPDERASQSSMQEAATDSSREPDVEGKSSRRWPWQSAHDEGPGPSAHIINSEGRDVEIERQAEDGDAPFDTEQGSKPWWESLAGLIGRRDEQKASDPEPEDRTKEEGSVQGDKPASRGQIETVVVSPDLPIAEIAAEIARVKVKEEQDADEQNRLAGEKMMQGPIAQLGRISDQLMKLSKPELVLLCGLSGGVLVLLAVIAYRLELYVQYESIVKDLVQ